MVQSITHLNSSQECNFWFLYFTFLFLSRRVEFTLMRRYRWTVTPLSNFDSVFRRIMFLRMRLNFPHGNLWYLQFIYNSIPCVHAIWEDRSVTGATNMSFRKPRFFEVWFSQTSCVVLKAGRRNIDAFDVSRTPLVLERMLGIPRTAQRTNASLAENR